jgi:molybdopterin synthase catalytic subunit
MTLLELRHEPLSVDEAVRAVQHEGAGAIALFLGVVRNHNDGNPVVLLEYEAYAPMASKELQQIAQQIAQQSPGVKVAAIHRLGSLQVGDIAVICAASAAHRREAFQACRALIDRIKAQVPIWKREHGPQGAYWVDWIDARCSGDDHDHAAHAHSDPHDHDH